MKKLNNKGFGHVEILIVVAVVAVTALIGGFVWQNSKSKDSSADTVATESSSRTGIKKVGKKYKGIQIYACRASSKPRDGVKVKVTNDGSSSLRRGVFVNVKGPDGTTSEDSTKHLDSNGDYVLNWFQYPNPSYKNYKFNTKIWLAKNYSGLNTNPLVVLHIAPLNGEQSNNLPDVRFKNLNLCS